MEIFATLQMLFAIFCFLPWSMMLVVYKLCANENDAIIFFPEKLRISKIVTSVCRNINCKAAQDFHEYAIAAASTALNRLTSDKLFAIIELAMWRNAFSTEFAALRKSASTSAESCVKGNKLFCAIAIKIYSYRAIKPANTRKISRYRLTIWSMQTIWWVTISFHKNELFDDLQSSLAKVYVYLRLLVPCAPHVTSINFHQLFRSLFSFCCWCTFVCCCKIEWLDEKIHIKHEFVLMSFPWKIVVLLKQDKDLWMVEQSLHAISVYYYCFIHCEHYVLVFSCWFRDKDETNFTRHGAPSNSLKCAASCWARNSIR